MCFCIAEDTLSQRESSRRAHTSSLHLAGRPPFRVHTLCASLKTQSSVSSPAAACPPTSPRVYSTAPLAAPDGTPVAPPMPGSAGYAMFLSDQQARAQRGRVGGWW